MGRYLYSKKHFNPCESFQRFPQINLYWKPFHVFYSFYFVENLSSFNKWESSTRKFYQKVLSESSIRKFYQKVLPESSIRKFYQKVLSESSIRKFYQKVLSESSTRKFYQKVLSEMSIEDQNNSSHRDDKAIVNSQNKSENENCLGGPSFYPPLYIQRYSFVKDILDTLQPESVSIMYIRLLFHHPVWP